MRSRNGRLQGLYLLEADEKAGRLEGLGHFTKRGQERKRGRSVGQTAHVHARGRRITSLEGADRSNQVSLVTGQNPKARRGQTKAAGPRLGEKRQRPGKPSTNRECIAPQGVPLSQNIPRARAPAGEGANQMQAEAVRRPRVLKHDPSRVDQYRY